MRWPWSKESDMPVEPIGADSVVTSSIRFVGDSEKTETPICPRCNADLEIDAESPDVWQLTCDCDETPAFEIHRADSAQSRTDTETEQ